MQPNPDELKKDIESMDYEDDFEAKQNWLGFWGLLLEIDLRVNPQLYKKPKNNEDNGSPNNPNKA